MKLTDELITERIKNCPKDQYGQTHIFDKQIHFLLPEFKKEKVKKFLKENSKLYQLSLYAGRIGEYYAISKKYHL